MRFRYIGDQDTEIFGLKWTAGAEHDVADPHAVGKLSASILFEKIAARGRNGVCGAHARSSGRPCRAMAMANGRCKLHGGKSTGPKTEEGRKRCAEAVRARWARARVGRDTEAAKRREMSSGWG